MPRTIKGTSSLILALLSSLLLITSNSPICHAETKPTVSAEREKLNRGEVITGMKTEGATRFVTGTVVIDQAPDKVWPVISNPYEFLGKISPRMKGLEVTTDRSTMSVMKVNLDVSFLIPHFFYVVESNYENSQRIDFHRVGGVLRDFKGSWQLTPLDGGKKSELTYSMYLDPGFAVPQWIIREGMKSELPKTLMAVKRRVQALSSKEEALESRTILAAAVVHHEVGDRHKSLASATLSQ